MAGGVLTIPRLSLVAFLLVSALVLVVAATDREASTNPWA
jgi:hypothetical protein